MLTIFSDEILMLPKLIDMAAVCLAMLRRWTAGAFNLSQIRLLVASGKPIVQTNIFLNQTIQDQHKHHTC